MMIVPIETERLILMPYTLAICKNILNNNFIDLEHLQLKKGIGWPDEDVLVTLPKIITTLEQITEPTGFESWMIIKKNTRELIGDCGFKGLHKSLHQVDLGYGIIQNERGNGYATEACKALIEWVFAMDNRIEITANCECKNESSIQVLTKLNFTKIKTIKGMIYWRKQSSTNKKAPQLN
jgi:ribosomal-protein-alanine N-acetyltransferase